jgi:hypothetical protein
MKRFLFFLVLLVSGLACDAQPSESSAVLMCHNNGAGLLTSFIEVRAYNPANKTTRLVGRFLASGTPYTPGAGTISFGSCTSDNNCLVQRLADHDDVIATTKTYAANTLHSLSFTVRKGTASVTVNGKTTDYPMYFTEKYQAPNDCSYIANSITIVSSDTVKVAIIK